MEVNSRFHDSFALGTYCLEKQFGWPKSRFGLGDEEKYSVLWWQWNSDCGNHNYLLGWLSRSKCKAVIFIARIRSDGSVFFNEKKLNMREGYWFFRPPFKIPKSQPFVIKTDGHESPGFSGDHIFDNFPQHSFYLLSLALRLKKIAIRPTNRQTCSILITHFKPNDCGILPFSVIFNILHVFMFHMSLRRNSD